MDLIITPSSHLNGRVRVPSSKSHSIRALFFALLSRGTSVLSNVLESDDTQDSLGVLKALGVDIGQQGHTMTLTSAGCPLSIPETTIYTGNSGVTTHFLLPLLGLRKHPEKVIVVDCGDQMRARPIHALVQALQGLGLKIKHLQTPEKLPIAVSGQLLGGSVEVSGLTSQYVSALLMALPCAPNDSCITVHHLQERSYMEMTLTWLDKLGMQYTHHRTQTSDTFEIKGGQQYQPFEASIAGDFSSASYLIAAAALGAGQVTIDGLDMQDSQEDKRLVMHLKEMGADITIQDQSLLIQGGKPLQGIVIDANNTPDLLPTLAVIGTQASGCTQIVNVPHARIKETDRIHSMTQGLKRMGASIEERPDGLTVYSSKLTGAQVQGYGDHRTVMALAIAGLSATQETVVEGCEAVSKTFPNFVETLAALGAKMRVAR